MSAGGDVEGVGDAVDGFEGGEADLLDLDVDVLALAGRFVEGDFLDEEIFGPLLDGAGDAGEVGGEVGEVHLGRL